MGTKRKCQDSEGDEVIGNSTHQPSRKKKKKKRKKSKAESKKEEESTTTAEEITGSTKIETQVAADEFPYPTDPDDHCESPKVAYENMQPILQALARNSKSPFRIYDPYYCAGAVRRNLEELGFPEVYNEKEDCYKVWESNKLPRFDLLVTNPPYSGDHIEKLMKFVTSSTFGSRPWLLLLPAWVHKKDYYVNATRNISPFYIVPRKRYVYKPPPGSREAKKSDTHKKSSPFVSQWFIWGGSKADNERLMTCFRNSKVAREGTCDLARSKSALRDLRRKKR